MIIGMAHNGSPSLRPTLAESSNKDDATSGARGSLGYPGPHRCNVVISTASIVTTPVLKSTPDLHTISTVMVQTMAPQPGMELLPNQQQAYHEVQQARACTRQINVERGVTQHHDKLAGLHAALNAQMIEHH
jgi:hypothetical protein